MSTLINLLPDLRQAKLRERHRRQLVTGISIATWIACGVVVAVMFVIVGGQQLVISSATTNIKNKEQQLQGISGLSDAVTVNQHLAALPGLYANRVYLTKFFKAYTQADPVSISIASLAVDAQNVLTLRGTAPNYAEVAKLDRAMSLSNVKVGTGSAAGNNPYFTGVTIVSVDSSDKTTVNFSITANLDPGVKSGN